MNPFRQWWERQKEFGRWLDSYHSPDIKPDYYCLFPGCENWTRWIYLDNCEEWPVRKPEDPIPYGRPKEDFLRWHMTLGACDVHRRENCVWTRRNVHARRKS